MEHHSNLIPWQQVCRETGAKLVYLYPTKTGQLTTEEVLAKVGPKTKILAVGQVSNVLGVENPVKNLGKLVHKYGGYLVVDGAQSLPHMPVDVADLGADFFAFSAHKAMGPMGIGVLWGKMDLLNAMPPMLTGGEMIDSVTEQDAVWGSPSPRSSRPARRTPPASSPRARRLTTWLTPWATKTSRHASRHSSTT